MDEYPKCPVRDKTNETIPKNRPLLLLIVLDKIVTISHMFGLFSPNHRVLNFVTRVTNVTRVTK